MDLSKKKLLVLGGASYMPYIREYADKEGFLVYCAGGTHNKLMERFSDAFFLVEATDKYAIEQLISEKKIDGVVSLGNENLIDATIDIAAEAKLPFYLDRKNWNEIQDKEQFKKHCREYDIPVVPGYSCSGEDPEEYKALKYPVVIKPADSSGSQGVSVCEYKGALDKAIEKAMSCSRTGRFLIEEYCLAPEFIATYIIEKGVPIIWMLGDRYMNRLQHGFGGLSNCSFFPSIFADQYMEEIHPKMVRLLQKYGPENGTFFVQGFAQDNQLAFFDPALRFCGTLDIIPYSAVMGINPLHWMINHSFTGVMDFNHEIERMDWRLKGKKIAELSLLVSTGTIGHVEGLEDVKNDPHIIEVVQLLDEGDVVDKQGTLQQVAARIFLACDDFRTAVSLIEKIYDIVKISDVEGSDMLMPFMPYGLNRA